MYIVSEKIFSSGHGMIVCEGAGEIRVRNILISKNLHWAILNTGYSVFGILKHEAFNTIMLKVEEAGGRK